MADWEHKERNWNTERIQLADGKSYSVRELQRAGVEGVRNFAVWLDLQCKDGWEVIKIARDFSWEKNTYGESIQIQKTWCVFRRKVE